jgi:osmotically-inducible protein OsmY
MHCILRKIVSSVMLSGAFLVPPGLGLAEELFQADPQQKTADNQKNNKADTALTAEIRKALVADKALSMSAHNVKVITSNGIVTLRGKVESEDERASVVGKAKDLAGATNVNDDLTVSPAKDK